MGYTLAMEKYDVGIVGGGIVGLATALTLKQRHPDLDLCVVETEGRVASHQTGRNYGVLNSGILISRFKKANHCRLGKQLMEDFVMSIMDWDRRKVVVATQASEVSDLIVSKRERSLMVSLTKE